MGICAKRLHLFGSILLAYVETIIFHVFLEFIRLKQYADAYCTIYNANEKIIYDSESKDPFRNAVRRLNDILDRF